MNKMNNRPNVKLSSHFVLTAVLSGSITIGLSLIYILLCIAGIVIRFSECNDLLPTTGSDFFWKTIVSAYILDKNCPQSTLLLQLVDNQITSEYTVFVLTTITLCFTVVCLASAITLISIVQDEGSSHYLNYVVPTYIGTCIAVLVVDLTTAAHFGIDQTHLSLKLDTTDSGAGGNYTIEAIRQGALILMSIALKGYVAYVINIVLMILLVVYALEHRIKVKNNEHSIHKLGALTAFDQPRKPNDNNNWSSQPEMFSPFARGAQVNNAFNEDESPPRTPNRREPPRSDYNHSNGSFDRSDSWHHSQPNLAQSSRPFSYLEDKRPMPSRPPPSPAVEAPWRRDRDPWSQAPPVPAPDYSPQHARRLKSALKPGYM